MPDGCDAGLRPATRATGRRAPVRKPLGNAVHGGPDVAPTQDHRRRDVDAHFEVTACDWDSMYGRRDVVGAIHQRRLHRALGMIEAMQVPRGSTVLELGCGAGLMAVELANRGLSVQATDVIEAMRERTRQRVTAAGLDGQITVGTADAEEIPFADCTFDMVVALGVLPWVESPLRAAAEVRRVLRPSGCAILTVGNRWRLTFMIDPLLSPAVAPFRRVAKTLLDAVGHPVPPRSEVRAHLMRAGEFERVLAATGLRVEEAETLGFGPVTFWRRTVLPRRAGLRVDAWLQGRADRGVAVVRSLGAQHLILARRPA